MRNPADGARTIQRPRKRTAAVCCSVLAMLALACTITFSGSRGSTQQFDSDAPRVGGRFGYQIDEYIPGKPEYSVVATNTTRHLDAGKNGRVRVMVAQSPLTPDIMSMADREKQLDNIGLDGCLIYDILWELDFNKKIKPYLDDGYRVVLNLEFVDTYPNLKAIGDGVYDGQLQKFIDDLKKDGRLLILRPLHEFNGGWYEWGVYAGGDNSIENFKYAWKRVVNLFRKSGANVWFQLNYNNRNGNNSKTPLKDFYPGDEWVDEVTISGYNRGAFNGNYQTFREVMAPAYYTIREFTDKPINIGETSTPSTSEGEKGTWIRDAFKIIADEFDRCTEVTFFLFNKETMWDLNSDWEIKNFKEGIEYVREATQGESWGPKLPPPQDVIDDLVETQAPSFAPVEPQQPEEPVDFGPEIPAEETFAPTMAPTMAPTFAPTMAPTSLIAETLQPTARATARATVRATLAATRATAATVAPVTARATATPTVAAARPVAPGAV